MDELEAIRAYQSGRADAFAVLFELHAAHVYRTSYLITRDVGRAEDVAQETFLILAQRLPGLTPGPLRSWLGRVAANLSLNERRRAWDLPLEGLPPHSRAILEARDALAGADTIVEQADERRRLREAVATLAPRQRAMVVLRYYGDCSLDEIATALGPPTCNTISPIRRVMACPFRRSLTIVVGRTTWRRVIPATGTARPMPGTRARESGR